nr:hypothetical protein [Sinomicrobium weinanense]
MALVICFRPAFPFLEYAANYDYISKVLCINKDRPEVHCYGKCYLMKAVKKESQNDHGDKPATKFEYQLLYVHDREEPTPVHFSYVHTIHTPYPPENYTSRFGKSPLKPPIVLL